MSDIYLNFSKKYSSAIEKISVAISRAGGRAYLVGGCIRDLLLDPDIDIKDIDFEVFDLDSDRLASVLQSVSDRDSTVNMVGKQFGVFKIVVDGFEFDIAQPRMEISTGDGHRDFEIRVAPNLPIEKAVLRRDLTINAIMCDPLDNYRVIDILGGVDDLRSGLLRPTSPAFKEDPLRPLRAVQFASRFGLRASEELIEMSYELKTSFQKLSHDRVAVEWGKWAKGSRPDLGLKTLVDIGWLDLFPSIETAVSRAGIGAFRLAELASAFPLSSYSPFSRLVLFISHLTFFSFPDDLDKIDSLASSLVAEMGYPSNPSLKKELELLVPAFINIARGVGLLCSTHESANTPELRAEILGLPTQDFTAASLVRHISHQLSSASFVLNDLLRWYAIVASDRPTVLAVIQKLRDTAIAEGVVDAPMLPLIKGKDLVEMGYAQGPEIGRILRFALKEQIAGRIPDRATGLSLIKKTFPLPARTLKMSKKELKRT